MVAVSGFYYVVGGGEAGATARELASSLSKHSLAGVPLTVGTDAMRYEEALADLSNVPVEVAVEHVDSNDGQAVVTLSWAWRLEPEQWAYTTEARLVKAGERWQVDWQPSTLAPQLGPNERLDLDDIGGARGRITGAGGTALVIDRPVMRFGLDKSRIDQELWRSSATAIARAVDVDAKAYRKKIEAYGDKAFVEAIVLRTDDAATEVPGSYAGIPGAAVVEDAIPLAPTKSFASSLLGTVGPASAEVIQASDGAVEEGQEVGLSGLQARYESLLARRPGTRVQAVGASGLERTLFKSGGQNGHDLRTTIDSELQQRAETVLASHISSEQGPDSALVAIRPSTGEVLAAANGPANEGFNAATTGQYAPGSTFKVITSLALLRSEMAPDDVVDCPSTTVVDGKSFKNYDDYPADRLGAISLTTAIANSCNTALIDERERLKSDTLTEAGAALGLGVDHDLGFPAYVGQVPPAEGETEAAADMIGQGRVLASPLGMAVVAASVSAGRAVLPVLLPDHTAKQKTPARPLTNEEAQTLRDFMRAVVTEGSGGFLADVPGDVGAKTGTAEYGMPAADGSLPTHTWMIGFRDDLAVAVFVETGVSGSQTAGPILEDFLR